MEPSVRGSDFVALIISVMGAVRILQDECSMKIPTDSSCESRFSLIWVSSSLKCYGAIAQMPLGDLAGINSDFRYGNKAISKDHGDLE
ncbi:hypothetical protein L1987_10585 [Smallanthus sonchifolius]|uniref:Uncharacterized protein n=1 Tax=Smallanthus sonchifolius TaxID=185202 RepID=A0ACB9JSJ0_9ASTR|nr:hypothetical protein L1987_10585 [Smallanthus sonchifolius]